MYQFPDKQQMRNSGMRAIYMQYYLKDWSSNNNAEFAIANGIRVRENVSPTELGRVHTHTCLDSDFHPVNQLLKYYKLGFGYATDEACYDIREKLITRDEGIARVKKYDGRCSDYYIKGLCDYLEITEGEFWRVVEGFVNKDLFYKDKTNYLWRQIPWRPRFEVGVGL